ncbi:putative dsRNA-binding protein [Truepera radiovictrix]|uniref:Double-stranded RNA binding domain protein n=1 Tax=Truepera radiovictrix (strain DSM 17093 / CIP 108686 / LMG 22925 / RQ-24) TaxID=649638 RepID=D7CUI9_TRURR|nr:putative dsRNA-binding protein [Truepera radiovictrix]ADI15774.1 double-stranded RNA binding domain protein [Truepera radiovictrix DSM 17093]WMT58599.1 putative dsRNA-binding protein [Truepera radiovictrix]
MQHPKGTLIERCKQLRLGAPSFNTRNLGPDHEPRFESEVLIQGEVYGRGEAGTKRDAERRASEEALEALEALAARTGAAASHRAQDQGGAGDEPFTGPWPIFPEVLAASLTVAGSRVNPTLMGETAILEVQALALQLYKGTLEALGEVMEIEEEVGR